MLIDGGLVVPSPVDLSYYDLTNTTNLAFYAQMAGSGTFDIDAAYLIPANEDSIMLAWGGGAATTASNLNIIGSRQQYMDGQKNRLGQWRGNLWTATPGNIMTRYIYAFTATDNAHSLTAAADVTLTVTPRVRHLIGTI